MIECKWPSSSLDWNSSILEQVVGNLVVESTLATPDCLALEYFTKIWVVSLQKNLVRPLLITVNVQVVRSNKVYPKARVVQSTGTSSPSLISSMLSSILNGCLMSILIKDWKLR